MTEPSPITHITGAEFKDFYLNNWPSDDYYIEDVGFEYTDEDGNLTLADDAVVPLSDCGYLCWQGKEGDGKRLGMMWPFEDFYRAYAEKKTHEIIVYKVPVDKVAEADAAIIALGGERRTNQAAPSRTEAEPHMRTGI